jgi:hypothetical protein
LLGHSLKDCNPEYDGPPEFVSPLAFLCSSCGKTSEIIDTKEHGYNSEIDRTEGGSWDSNYRGTGERMTVPCPECGGIEFFMTCLFAHQQFDLIEDEPELEPTAQDYFHWFECMGRCALCAKESILAGFELA